METIEGFYISHFQGTERTEPQLEMPRKEIQPQKGAVMHHLLF